MKLICWNCRGLGNLTTIQELKQLLVANNPDIVFLCQTKLDVSIQNYSKHYLDSLVHMKNHSNLRFTGFYGHPDPNLRNRSWEMLRRYDVCWAKENESKIIIKVAWNNNATNLIRKFDRVRMKLGVWQRGRYSRMKKQIHKLETNINKIIDASIQVNDVVSLKKARSKVSHLYAKDEYY
ncbi:hypothetical protein ES288_A06G151300v1 [Gossypium darwinii]|uniref:Endonuclease/exonuclease/phosphatase domain-containing protein n=1 Tax=Gossypium darwinii TaxID=34276 RepID=A0A5D2G910_GOSDA|nr:hypothetical protein ES288_A06G151300v1 [Gossypium darwinii]